MIKKFAKLFNYEDIGQVLIVALNNDICLEFLAEEIIVSVTIKGNEGFSTTKALETVSEASAKPMALKVLSDFNLNIKKNFYTFAKLYDFDDVGQVLVTKTDIDGKPAIKIDYINSSNGEASFSYLTGSENDSIDEKYDDQDRRFEQVNKEQAYESVSQLRVSKPFDGLLEGCSEEAFT